MTTSSGEQAAANAVLVNAELQARAYHEREAPEAIALWNGGISLLITCIEFAQESDALPPEGLTQVTLAISSAQSMMLALRLAKQGYYLQALNLCRAPFEYQTAMQYLHFRPSEHDKFTDLSKKTPRFSAMKDGIVVDLYESIVEELGEALARKQSNEYGSNLQIFINDLHSFSHPDRRAVALIAHFDQGRAEFQIGPQEDSYLFRACAERACGVLALLIHRALEVRRSIGLSDIEGAYAYVERLSAWKAEYGASEEDAPIDPSYKLVAVD